MINIMTYEFENFPNESQYDYDPDKILSESFLPSDLVLTETQNELVEKFNAAFVEAQNSTPKPPQFFPQTNEIIENFSNIFQGENFDENFYETDENTHDLLSEENTNFLLDIFLTKSPKQDDNLTEVGSYNSSSLDYGSEQSVNYFNLEDAQNYGFVCDEEKTQTNFFIPPPFKPFQPEESQNLEDASTYESFDDLGLSDIDFCENLSNNSFDIETITTELCQNDNYDFDCDGVKLERNLAKPVKFTLPSVTTFGKHFAEKKCLELENFMRNSPADTINIFAQDSNPKNACGHLLGNKPANNNLSEVSSAYTIQDTSSNQIILPRDEAMILHDDPLLSSSSMIFPNGQKDQDESDMDEDGSSGLQCKWDGCWEKYQTQKLLVKHIEKAHVEMKKGEEFSCFWINCPRKNKPFNARYKLLIHMRVHSGEKPNKCPFKGCSKAFSRLENLKIHQRSHTGERPYLCQFNSCTKSFSNSSDRAKHQRTHFDTKPYACQIAGCQKRYTDPSSLRKHVKNHTATEQAQLKRKQQEIRDLQSNLPRQNSSDSIQRVPTSSGVKHFRKISINSLDNTQGHFRKISFSSDDQSSTIDSTFFSDYMVKNDGSWSNQDHSYSTCAEVYENFVKENLHRNIKMDLKNKISEKNRQKKMLLRAESF